MNISKNEIGTILKQQPWCLEARAGTSVLFSIDHLS